MSEYDGVMECEDCGGFPDIECVGCEIDRLRAELEEYSRQMMAEEKAKIRAEAELERERAERLRLASILRRIGLDASQAAEDAWDHMSEEG